jgi:hypothetical protein
MKMKKESNQVTVRVPRKVARLASLCLEKTKGNPALPQFVNRDELVNYAVECFLREHSS